MIFGIGTDVVEVARINDSVAEFGDTFAKKILAESEMLSYQQSNIKSRFLAKRFAAKEAFSKALGTGLRAPATLQNIAVSHDDLGKPILVLAPVLQAFLDSKNINKTHISISDEKNLAAAFVVLEM
ncbi:MULTISPECIES: holo-ACP synthase [Methylotenera]|jgi:holo-[acyl-carrier protein] synthase|uniref:Holo-[acyl-carrier-protein] synthase n=1 Tax=Methylotenera mobilis TaxID=359408 RepID=A0A351RB84_9PROT|nr:MULTISPECIES: holo-ACP synthase [Methylotenera]MDP3210984.1 holo-ACP synthase [Methylotenera sp.]PPC95636.1 MAG: holo-ACP synthase [Methylotenera sp.]HBA09305.1 holo-ACP synthase [Methylotenera mobilis]